MGGAPQRPEVAWNPRCTGLRCVVCGGGRDRAGADWTCPDCGVDGILDVEYAGPVERALVPDHPAGGLWRFAPLLPVAPTAAHPCWTLGGTPLHDAPRLAAHLGQAAILLKDDTGLPSASLKDRAAAMAMAHAHLLGARHLACASTGNAAASLAVLAARAGVPCTIHVPAGAPPAKLAQLRLHGAAVEVVDGSYDEAFELSLEAIATHRWYSRNCAHNPFLVEGKKTAALELAATLTRGFTARPATWPDAVLVPVGDGCIVAATAKALRELHGLGLVPAVPRVIGVQAEGAAPLADAWAACLDDPAGLDGRGILARVAPVRARTVADSIRVGVPRNRVKAWRQVAATGGGFVAVPDEAILEAVALLAARAGVFAEPSAAAGLAGLRVARERRLLAADECVAVLVTGHGLKDPGAAAGRVSPSSADPAGA